MHMKRHKPDKDWMLVLLGSLNPTDEIFKKGYKPLKKNFTNAQKAGNFPLREGFFDGLDVLSGKDLRKKSSVNFMSKKERLEM
jgi:hypothetical protein